MSFSSTPLGQGRRRDHSAFLGKPTSSLTDSLPSYGFGAPALGSRSPPKPTSPSRDRNRSNTHENDGDEHENEPALVRFARLKQRESAADLLVRPGGPKIITSPPAHPEKWNVKDTSVNIATAFIQAAASDMSTHNNSWASTSSRTPVVPRSTSVEFEQAAPGTASGPRRLPAPPNKLSRPPVSSQTRKPPSSKSGGPYLVPDSEGEEDRNARGKSPFEVGMNIAKQAIGAAAFYVRQRSQEPENLSREQNQSHEQPSGNARDGNESSYSYREEESAFLASKRAKKGRISVDNKAYKPTQSDEEYSEYSSDDGKPTKRKKSTKGGHGGPLTSLPVVGNSKKRRRLKKSTLGGAKNGAEGGPEEASGSEDDETADVSTSTVLRASMTRGSVPPASNVPSRLSREPRDRTMENSMNSMELGLDSIPEIAEDLLDVENSVTEPAPVAESVEPIQRTVRQRRSRSRTPAPVSSRSPAFSIGGFLGSIVHFTVKLGILVFSSFISVFTASGFLFGNVLGKMFDLCIRRPFGWARGASPLLPFVLPGAALFLSWYILRTASLGSYVPSLSFPSRAPAYQAPEVPPANLGEFADRLVRIETTLTGLSADTEKLKAEDGMRSYTKLLDRIGSLENKLSAETKKTRNAEAMAQDAVSRAIHAIKQEVEVIQSQITVQQRQQEKNQKTPSGGVDEEARSRLQAFEERIAGVEGSAREALELGKKAAAAPAAPSVPASGWWSKPATGSNAHKDLNIRSADGQDVSALITHLVDNAVSRISKDGISKADFAMHSAGARVIPSLTSPTLELRPKGLGNQILGLFTGTGYFGFQPPLTALHYDTHAGRCWPFAGDHGQLGVMLVAPAYIEEVTIDHIAKDLAFDLKTAPRHMEVWGLVEGADNLAKLEAWKAERATSQEAGAADGAGEDEESYPAMLPKDAEYLRLAQFTYDVEADNHVQTFPVDAEIRDLGIDFGVVVLRVLDNWGRKEFTCLYRFRVHGQKMGEVELPFSVDS